MRMALQLRTKHRTLTNPSLVHLFSTSSSDPSDSSDPTEPNPQSHSPSVSDYFSDVKPSLLKQQSPQQQQWLSRYIAKNSSFFNTAQSRRSQAASLDEIRNVGPNPMESNSAPGQRSSQISYKPFTFVDLRESLITLSEQEALKKTSASTAKIFTDSLQDLINPGAFSARPDKPSIINGSSTTRKGQGKGNVKEEGKDAGNYDKWSNEESNELLQLLVDAAHRGWRDPQSGMIDKKTVLSKILQPFNQKLGCEKTYKHYTSRVKWFKKQYTQYSELMRHSSGFGWDPIMKKFTAPEEVWEDYFKAHPKQRNIRHATHVDYEYLQIAVGNGCATGKNSIGLGDETEATTYQVEDSEHGTINDLVYNKNADAFILATDESSYQAYTPPVSPLPFGDMNEQVPQENIISKNTASSATEKHSRQEFEKKNSSTEAITQADVMKRLSSGIGSIATNFNKMYDLMEKRESRDTKCWDAIKETPGLSDDTRYMALELLNTKALKDVFLNMTPEERFKWIEFKRMH